MHSIPIISISQNFITVADDANIGEDDLISFDERVFCQISKFQAGTYIVHGDIPSNATSLKCGKIATTDKGIRFLSHAEENQRLVDAEREKQQKQIKSMSVEGFLFSVLTEQELEAILLSSDMVMQKGLLRMSLVDYISNNDQWVVNFIQRLVSQNILTAVRADNLWNIGSPPNKNR